MNNAIRLRHWMLRNTGLALSFIHGGQLLSALIMSLVLGALLAGNPAALTPWLKRIATPRTDTSIADAGIRQADLAAADRRVAMLPPEMLTALDFVAKRYRVSAEALTPVFRAALTSGRKQNLKPLLIIAVIAVESRFNPLAESVVGAQGLMQIIPYWHQDKIPEGGGTLTLFDPQVNVQVGTVILADSIRRMGGLMPGLQYFAGALEDPERGYANKILAEKLRIEGAVRRGGLLSQSDQ